MVLKDSLYSIQKKQQQESSVCYDLALHADHFIYQAHFPGEPITPGVCVIQMAKELLEDHLQRPLAVSMVKNVKFLAVISPIAHPLVRYTIDRIQEGPDGVKAVVDVTVGEQLMTHISLQLN